MKLLPKQVQLESAGHSLKTVVITLSGDQTLDDLVGTPGAWKHIQTDRTVCVHRGCEVHVWSADGTVLAQSLTVIKAVGGEVWLGAPARLINMEVEGLYEDASHSIIAVGAGYSIRHKRTWAVEQKVYQTVGAAKSELSRRQPVAV